MNSTKISIGLIVVALAALIGGGLVSASKAPAAPTGVAFVDMQRAIDATDDAKKVGAELKADLEAKRKQLAEASISAAKTKFKTEAAKAESAAKVKELGERLQNEYNAKEKAATQPIVGRMKKTIESLAATKHVVVVSAQAALYVPSESDLTDEAIGAYGSGKAPLAATASAAAEIEALKAEVAALKKHTN